MDSYKFLPRSFREGFEQANPHVDEPVWTELGRPVEQATVALLTSAGLYLKDSQPPFDVEREKREPLWGDPTYRVIPRDVAQEQIGATHLHLNTRDFFADFNVALPIRPFAALEAEGAIGRLAAEHYSVMGYQAQGCKEWRERSGPEIAQRLHDAEVHALILAPA